MAHHRKARHAEKHHADLPAIAGAGVEPVENIGQYMRHNWLSNRVFDGYDDIIDAACDAWQKPLAAPEATSAYTLTLADPTLTSIDWEATLGNWVAVDAATMKAIGITVGRHVQACFSTLRSVQADIATGTITTTAEVDAAD